MAAVAAAAGQRQGSGRAVATGSCGRRRSRAQSWWPARLAEATASAQISNTAAVVAAARPAPRPRAPAHQAHHHQATSTTRPHYTTPAPPAPQPQPPGHTTPHHTTPHHTTPHHHHHQARPAAHQHSLALELAQQLAAPPLELRPAEAREQPLRVDACAGGRGRQARAVLRVPAWPAEARAAGHSARCRPRSQNLPAGPSSPAAQQPSSPAAQQPSSPAAPTAATATRAGRAPHLSA